MCCDGHLTSPDNISDSDGPSLQLLSIRLSIRVDPIVNTKHGGGGGEVVEVVV